MLSSHLLLGLPRGSLAFGPPNQNPVNISHLPMRATCPAPILLDLITLTIFGEEEDCEIHNYVIFPKILLPLFQVQISS
jgi:hypothetical protein